MKEPVNISRRRFIQLTLAASGALLIKFPLESASAEASLSNDSAFKPNAWLRVDTDNTFTLVIDRSEMGQGIQTALSMIMAEELDAPMSSIKTVFAPVDRVYNDPQYRMQMTGGSTSVAHSWDRFRQVGASVRQLFLQAAAQQWKVDESLCETADANVINSKSSETIPYAALIKLAASMRSLDLEDAPLKDPKKYTLIGKPQRRLDTPEKLDGTAVFGIDVEVPDMLIATLRQAPVFGSTVVSFNKDDIRSMTGVKHVLNLETAIAVVADHFWHANRAADALQVKWSKTIGDTLDDTSIFQRWTQLETAEEGDNARDDGNVNGIFEHASETIKAIYQLPYQAHATMEPMNCTAHVQKDRCDIWVATQAQTISRESAARITGLDHDQVFVHTTYLGGGFGRRGVADFVDQAVSISKSIGAPVQLIWTREEDMQHDFYRPANHNVLKASLDKNGMPIAWHHRIVSPPLMTDVVKQFSGAAMPDWFSFGVKDFIGSIASSFMGMRADPTAVEGAQNIPYKIANIKVDYIADHPGIPVGFWRSVGSSQNAFVVESFIDELAAKAGKDPYEYRRALLKEHPRQLRVLEEVGSKANWSSPAPEGRHKGIALHESFNTVVAQVVEISIDGNEIRVHRVDCAIDCGIAVNPNIIKQQMEGSIIYGLTAALKGKITIRNGRVEQSNFHDFQLLRITEAPTVVVHIVPSHEPPTGVGEPGVPPIAPALANAVFAATGKRIRTLPITPNLLN